MIALDAADLVVIAGRTLGIGTDAALDQMDIAAAQDALAEARPPGMELTGPAGAATAGVGLVRALLRHRPFPVHAQQVAVAAGLQFLSLNGWRADLDPPSTAAVVVEALASGRLTPGDAAAWLAPRLSRARRPGQVHRAGRVSRAGRASRAGRVSRRRAGLPRRARAGRRGAVRPRAAGFASRGSRTRRPGSGGSPAGGRGHRGHAPVRGLLTRAGCACRPRGWRVRRPAVRWTGAGARRHGLRRVHAVARRRRPFLSFGKRRGRHRPRRRNRPEFAPVQRRRGRLPPVKDSNCRDSYCRDW